MNEKALTAETDLARRLHNYGTGEWIRRKDRDEMLRIARACIDALDEIQRLNNKCVTLSILLYGPPPMPAQTSDCSHCPGFYDANGILLHADGCPTLDVPVTPPQCSNCGRVGVVGLPFLCCNTCTPSDTR